jgi:pimeloyl-ACP methyl ester carboxylesterase
VSEPAFVAVEGLRLEVAHLVPTAAAARPEAPPLVFLHEGLGSVALWRDFPAAVVEATGAEGWVYSRAGYGRSGPRPGPYAPDYMHREATEVLPALLAALGVERPVLVGHSDGASIALLHAARPGSDDRGLVLLAAHVVVEDVSVTSIAAARDAYAGGSGLRERLARYHDDVDSAFWGWNDIWLDPAFRAWDLRPDLPAVRCPTLVMLVDDDEFGTLAQVDAIEAGVAGPVQRLVLARSGHSPQRDQPAAVLGAIAAFVSGLAQSRT